MAEVVDLMDVEDEPSTAAADPPVGVVGKPETKKKAGSADKASTTTTKATRAVMWVEKYRPRDVRDVASQEEVVRSLLGAIEQGALPHLLFYGPPGTGKTSTILAVTRMLYHPDVWRDRVLEMNASDERGIKVIREKVKAFAQRAVGSQTHAGYASPPFKIIILDEADTMTKDAQGALRRTMEAYSNVTRFCLVCNYVSRIIEPLASRCAKYRFAPLATDKMRARLDDIAKAEHVAYPDAVFDKILECAEGDMRRAVTLLQSCVNYYGVGHSTQTDGAASEQDDPPLDPSALDELAGRVPAALVDALWAAIRAKDFQRLQTAIDDVALEGYPALAVITKLHDDLLDSTDVSDLNKAVILDRIAEADKALADGADDTLQLHDVAVTIMQHHHRK
mmetsp:Transcript_11711/g.47287  ORF Transcript_11711/g.47287 Transcript_11711/m.47287 type:complete len:393 (+) Transcript_11711:87-1265(+)